MSVIMSENRSEVKPKENIKKTEETPKKPVKSRKKAE